MYQCICNICWMSRTVKKCPTPAPSVMRCAQEGSAVTVAAWVSRSDLKRRSDGNTMLLLLGCASDPGCIRLKRGVHKYKMKYTAMIPSLSCQINQYGHGFLDDANTNKNRCSFLRILSLVSVCVSLEPNRSCRQATIWVEATHPWCTSEYTTSCWSTDLPVKGRGWDMMRHVLKNVRQK